METIEFSKDEKVNNLITEHLVAMYTKDPELFKEDGELVKHTRSTIRKICKSDNSVDELTNLIHLGNRRDPEFDFEIMGKSHSENVVCSLLTPYVKRKDRDSNVLPKYDLRVRTKLGNWS